MARERAHSEALVGVTIPASPALGNALWGFIAVAACCYGIATHSSDVALVVPLGLAAIGLPVLLWRGTQRHIRADASGLTVKQTLSSRFVPWDEVRHLHITTLDTSGSRGFTRLRRGLVIQRVRGRSLVVGAVLGRSWSDVDGIRAALLHYAPDANRDGYTSQSAAVRPLAGTVGRFPRPKKRQPTDGPHLDEDR